MAGGICCDPQCLGARGATTLKLSAVTVAELRNALQTAWQHALPKRR
jgi:hypothetical protein